MANSQETHQKVKINTKGYLAGVFTRVLLGATLIAAGTDIYSNHLKPASAGQDAGACGDAHTAAAQATPGANLKFSLFHGLGLKYGPNMSVWELESMAGTIGQQTRFPQARMAFSQAMVDATQQRVGFEYSLDKAGAVKDYAVYDLNNPVASKVFMEEIFKASVATKPMNLPL